MTSAPEPAAAPDAATALLGRLGELVAQLRVDGVAVTTGAHIDAAAALAHVPVDDLAALRTAWRATLVKQPDPDGVFDRRFAQVVRLARAAPRSTDDASRPRPAHGHEGGGRWGAGRGHVDGGLDQLIAAAITAGDAERLGRLAGDAVDAYAGIDDVDGTARYHLQRAMRALDLARLLGAAMRRRRIDAELSEFEMALARGELEHLLDSFRTMVATEIAVRLERRDADRAPDQETGAGLPLTATAQDAADRDLLAMSPRDLADMRRLVQPLARQLAARIARRRRIRSTGRLDPRRTMRRSLGAGGVPIDVVERRRFPHRPDLVLLCDVSGSVAPFAQFTLLLVNALHRELRTVRSFAFVDGVAEVTDLFAGAVHDLDVHRLVERRGVVGLAGHSDYGRALGEFVEHHLATISTRTTVLVCGDARSNHLPPGAEALRQIAARARRVYWLNPEPRAEWDTTDSVIAELRPWCREVFEVRTVRQLADVITRLV